MRTDALSDSDIGLAPQQGFVLATSVGANQVYLLTKGPDSVAIFDLATRAVSKRASSSVFAERPLAVPDGAFTLDAAHPFAIGLLRTDGTYARVIEPTSPHLVTFQRVKVAVVRDAQNRGGQGMVANRGHALNVVAPDKALLTRLSDGAGWLISVELGRAFGNPLWVDDDNVWITTALAERFDENGVIRIARAYRVRRMSRAASEGPTRQACLALAVRLRFISRQVLPDAEPGARLTH